MGDRAIGESGHPSEVRLRSEDLLEEPVFVHNLAGIMLTGTGGEIYAANPAACAMLQRSEEELRKLGRNAVVDMSDPAVVAFAEERARTGRASGELRLRRKDGTTFPAAISSSVFRTERGESRSSISFIDISERKRAEEQLELLAGAAATLNESLDLEETLGALARLVVPGLADMCTIDLVESGRLVRVAAEHRQHERAAWLRTIGERSLTVEREAGVFHVIRSGEPELVIEIDDRWIERASPDDARLRVGRELHPRSIVIVPLRARGATIGALTLAITDGPRRYDEADRRFAQRFAEKAGMAIENARLHRRALEATRLRDEVLGIVSHDLRNPLGAIRLNAQALKRDPTDRARLDAIIASVDRGDRLIRNLLTTHRAEAGALPMDRGATTIAPLLEEVVAASAAIAEAHGIALERRCEPGLSLFADRQWVMQMLGNLVDNALKFTAAGGRIDLAASRDEAGALVIAVSDTGCGIAPDALEHVFDRFWQGKNARRAGAGLGLAIVKGVADAHGATIAVTSEVGRGTTFTIRFPPT